jgi:hypothetical protein
VHTTGPNYQGSIITPSKSLKKKTSKTPGSMKKATPASKRVINDENNHRDQNQLVVSKEIPGKLTFSSSMNVETNDQRNGQVVSPMTIFPRGQGILVEATKSSYPKPVTEAAAVVQENVVAGNASEGEGIKAMVHEALDVMLRASEIDDRAYRRLSTQTFHPSTLRRLSMTELPPKCLSADDVDVYDLNSATTGSVSRPSMDSQGFGVSSSYTLKQSDVLTALRNYITALDEDTFMLSSNQEESEEVALMPVEEEDIAIAQTLLDNLEKDDEVVAAPEEIVNEVLPRVSLNLSARNSVDPSAKPARLTQYPMQNILAPALAQHRVSATIRDWVVWDDHVKYHLLVEVSCQLS